MNSDIEDIFLDFILVDSNPDDKKRPREASEARDDVSVKSEGSRRSTTPEPAKKKKKVEEVETKVVINEDIEVIEYAPHDFAKLRLRDGYS